MFNINRKVLASLSMLLTFNLAWMMMFSVSCVKVKSKPQQVNLQSDFIDYDCDNEQEYRPQNWKDESILRYFNEKQYFDNIILKNSKNKAMQQRLKRCVQQNFVASEQESNDKFKTFTTVYFKKYLTFEAVNNQLKKATNNRVDFNKILIHLNENHQLFKQTVIKLYNILAKLIGPQIVLALIFDLLVVNIKHQANNALATAIAYSVNNQVFKSCIVYTKEAIIFPSSSLLRNYIDIIWSSKNQYHPIIHEFAHSLDYFTRMSFENQVNLPAIAQNNDTKCNNNSNGNNILNADFNRKTDAVNLNTNPTFSKAASDLQEYLFVNIRNHNLENNDQSKKILASLIVPSEYGNENNRSEFFAEAFVYWISTLENKRGRNWQILNRFFLEYFKTKYYLS